MAQNTYNLHTYIYINIFVSKTQCLYFIYLKLFVFRAYEYLPIYYQFLALMNTADFRIMSKNKFPLKKDIISRDMQLNR